MAKKNILRTPKGVAVFPYFNTPDTKFDKDGSGGHYKTGLRLSKDAAQPLIDQIDQLMQESSEEAAKEPKNKIAKGKKPKQADPPYKFEVDNDGNETGFVVINFKAKAMGKRKDGTTYPRNLFVCDAAGKPIDTKKVRIYGGSEIKVGFIPAKFYTAAVGAGVTLYLEGVQVIALKTGGSHSASSLGFEAEEGFSVSELADEDSTEAAGEEKSNEGSDDVTGEGAGAANDGDF